jgi:hypothetical protein
MRDISRYKKFEKKMIKNEYVKFLVAYNSIDCIVFNSLTFSATCFSIYICQNIDPSSDSLCVACFFKNHTNLNLDVDELNSIISVLRLL